MDDYDFIPLEIRQRLQWKKTKKQPGDPDEIVGITCEPHPCESCGVRLETPRSLRMSISRNQLTTAHIKTQCQICKMYKNPTTGEFDCSFHDVNSHFLGKKINK